MSKFKPGDKVRVLPRLTGQVTQSPYYVDEMTKFAGKEYVIREKFRGFEWFELDNSEYTWHEEWLELVDRPFTQEDLEIGMLVELDNGTIYDVEAAFLDNSRKGEEVVAIYKPTETGFERVWTKPEPEPKLYKLACPLSGLQLYINQLKDYEWEIFGTKFTQEEIDNIPNQDLIKLLVKKEVVK